MNEIDRNWPKLAKIGRKWPKMADLDLNWTIFKREIAFQKMGKIPKMTVLGRNGPILTQIEPYFDLIFKKNGVF